ncbi:MAG: glycoside hydrolase [Acidobacteria bacterium]|nr:glycoside hydrolase [Acidobacteriota bacterium]
MKRLHGAAVLALAAAALLSPGDAMLAQNQADPLQQGFKTPPESARPRVWWHWMNGNITKEGIQADLEWMKRVGIGGFQNFDGNMMVPRFVEKPMIYMTPEWKDAFRFTAGLADKLGLEMAVAASPGWSETGGPWVKPEEAIKKYVWTETWVEGGRPFTGKLERPSDAPGSFQDKVAPPGRGGGAPPPRWYADARVFAYRVPEGARSQMELAPRVTASGLGGTTGGFGSPVPLDLALLSDGKVGATVLLAPTSTEHPTWVLFEYAQPVQVAALTTSVADAFPGFGEPDSGSRLRLEASDDGRAFRPVAEVFCNALQRTDSIPATRARYFRVVFLNYTRARTGFGPPPANQPAAPTGIPVAELQLRTLPTVNRFEVKANFGLVNDYYSVPPPKESGPVVHASDVINLTGRMRTDGTLDWTPPAGRWIVIRLGYSLTGHQNGPASAEATGLEVDKLSQKYVSRYINTYLDMMAAAAGKELVGARGLKYLLNDSYEGGQQNWTDDILEQFKKRRGYDPEPWLPVLVGTVVESSASSDRFTWDFRRTINELFAEAHYATVTAEAHKRGLKTYGEALEDRRAYFGDDMEMRQYTDVPMAAMWPGGSRGPGIRPTFIGDDRGAASVAHIYGRPFVAAESFTGSGRDVTPKALKEAADVELILGINRFVIHTSVHQPNSKGPGVGLGPIGAHFTRNEAWAELAGGWLDYLSRGSYLLQQGRFVADVAYFYGQEAPITGIWSFNTPTDTPEGYNFDFVNADVILNRLKVSGGALTTATGMNYRVLYMGERTSQITLPVLRKLRDFVNEGAVIVGSKPAGSPSLADDQAEFQRIATTLWGDGSDGEHASGKGKVFVNRTVNLVLETIGLGKDFDYSKPQADTLIWNHHRKLADGDVYYVVNRNRRAETFDASFRVHGKAVELWDPVTGRTSAGTYRTENGRTVVPLSLDPLGSVFVVMRKAGPASRVAPGIEEKPLGEIGGSWTVAFRPDRGAPASITMASLGSWTDQADPGVKYYSGTGSYTKQFEAPAAWFESKGQLWLDLGDVRELADVRVNGRNLGNVWRAPYRVEVTGVLKAGSNTVEIKVANTWINRLVGDQQAGATKIAFAPNPGAIPAAPIASGLLGPVRVLAVRTR